MKPLIRIRPSAPKMRVRGRSVIENVNSFVHAAGSPIGLLLALTYAESLIPTWTTIDTVIPTWAYQSQLTSPSWAK